MEPSPSIPRIRECIEHHRRTRPGALVALVPTMGALHEGHLSLLRIARHVAGAEGCVVASIFVNPTQFAPHEDFDSYPRDLDSDLDHCRKEGVDLVFTPEADEIYPPGASVSLVETRLSRGLCGASRPHFFGGVCTVVAKLFHIVQPDVAVFGEKDFQQLAIIRRMVRDLHVPLRIVSGPIVREADGLALSSRNARLSPEHRAQAPVLWRTLQRAAEAIETGERRRAVLRNLLERELGAAEDARIDYAEIVDPDTLEPLERIRGQALIALAVWFGEVRLIDNLCLRSLPT